MARTPDSRWRWVALLVVVVIYIAACATPAIEFAAERPTTDFGDLRFLPDYEAGPQLGITALACGWGPPWTIPWLANIALLTGAIFLILKKNRWALGCGVVAALLALSTWPFSNSTTDCSASSWVTTSGRPAHWP